MIRLWLESISKYYVCVLFSTAYVFMVFEHISPPDLFIAGLTATWSVLGFSVVYNKVVKK